MAVLQSTNVQGALCVNGVAVGGGKDIKFCCFTSTDTFTPSQDLVDGGGYIEASLGAGGGGGGGVNVNTQTFFIGAGGGGGGGEVLTRAKVLDSTSACTITIGAGGIGGCVPLFQDYGVCWFGCDSTAGGDTTALGFTAYGGGGGASFGCRETRGGATYAANIAGGPAGGNAHMLCCSSQACGGPWTTYFAHARGHGGTSTYEDINTSKMDVFNYTYPIDSTAVTTCTLCRRSSLSSTGNVKVSGSVSGAENSLYTSRTPLPNAGRASEIIGGLKIGAGGISVCDATSVAKDDLRGASSQYGGGGFGAARCGCNSSQEFCACGGNGTAGIVVLRWEE